MPEQGTPEWLAERCGKVTASKIADMLAKTKSGWGATRANYAAQLVAERLTGQPAESFCSPAMQWGLDHEADARRAYAFYADEAVEQTGFVPHPTILMAGASPDGLVGSVGMLELKCPNTATHIATLRSQAIPEKYRLQMTFQLACRPEREWNDFASYDPRLPEEMRLFVKRMDRDNAAIAEVEREVEVFLAEVEQTVAELTNLYSMKEAA